VTSAVASPPAVAQISTDEARYWLVKLSLIISGCFLGFMVLAPAFRFPLTWAQAQQLIQVVIPVFVGYLGAATAFVVGHTRPRAIQISNLRLMRLLVKGPVLVFSIGMAAALIAFGVSNSRFAPIGSGMSVEQLGWVVSSLLGLLTVTTNALIVRLFGAEER
jgi:hypothetical protein